MPSNQLSTVGDRLYDLIECLYPICRSITGDGVRQTFKIIQEFIPLTLHEVPTGTQVFDWTIPKEWNIRDAYIKNSSGERVVDFNRSNLHVVNYSVPIRKIMPLEELKPHLHSLPEQPSCIPYRTSYYHESWGFCLAHEQLLNLKNDNYEVVIDSSFEKGSLTYAEYFQPGVSQKEFLFYTHCCHPSLCNDNLSGLALLTLLGEWLQQQETYYSYRLIFAPGTIGSITWLSRNQEHLKNIKHGLVVTSLGDSGCFTYKKTRNANCEIDRIIEFVLKNSQREHQFSDFTPYGYDERQFCSPGINLPVGRLTRSANGCYPQYHTSADDLKFIDRNSLQESFKLIVDIIMLADANRSYINTQPLCEPQLGKRGLYKQVSGTNIGNREYAMLWLLNLSDSHNDLLNISEKSGIVIDELQLIANELVKAELLEVIDK